MPIKALILRKHVAYLFVFNREWGYFLKYDLETSFYSLIRTFHCKNIENINETMAV